MAICLCVCLTNSCSRTVSVTNNSQAQAANVLTDRDNSTTAEVPLESLPNAETQVKLPKVKDFGIVHVWRISNYKGDGGRMIPPFFKAEIGIGLDNEPSIGEKVTVVPLEMSIEPFQLRIIKTEKKEVPCSGKEKDFYWDTEIESVTNTQILEIAPNSGRSGEFPFDVMVIYPKVDFAKNMPAADFKRVVLPDRVSINTIEAAVDLDNDGNPDLLEIVFCCSNQTIPPSESCNYICKKSFRKTSGKWTLVNFAKPC